jgi:RNA polymerase sigma-70 factor (ECF subfamily)
MGVSFMACMAMSPMPVADLSEGALLRLAQQGNQAAFEELTGRTHEGCVRMAMSILRNRDDAEDEVQNAVWKAYTHLRLFNHQSAFSTWIIRIVINHCLMRCRRVRRVRFVSYETAGSEGEWYALYEPVQTETPEHSLGREQLNQVLRTEIRRIPPFLRAPLEMRYLQDRSLEDVASALGISVAATKSRLHRAQGYLKVRMLRHCGTRGAATLMAHS